MLRAGARGPVPRGSSVVLRRALAKAEEDKRRPGQGRHAESGRRAAELVKSHEESMRTAFRNTRKFKIFKAGDKYKQQAHKDVRVPRIATLLIPDRLPKADQ